MQVINPSGNVVLIDRQTKERLIENGDWCHFKLRQPLTIGTGPEHKICLLIQENGLGDHIHALPAIKALIDSGKDVTVYVPAFYAPLFEKLNVTVKDSEDCTIGFIEENIPRYGKIYSLSSWCIIHDEETDGDVTDDRFLQFAKLVDVELPESFSWRELIGQFKPVGPSCIGVALQSSSLRRSYQRMEELAYDIAGRWKQHPLVCFGGGPNSKASSWMFEAKTLKELIAEIQECSLIITVDNGILAVALALGIPVLAIFGPTQEQSIVWQFAQYIDCSNVRVLTSYTKDKSCQRPCSFQGRGFGVNGKCNSAGPDTFVDCLKEISVEQIIETAEELYSNII